VPSYVNQQREEERVRSARSDRLESGATHLSRAREVLLASLQLGLTSFGGPIAHLGYFERAYVQQRGWLTGEQYGSVVALCRGRRAARSAF
jgi:chromate transporter